VATTEDWAVAKIRACLRPLFQGRAPLRSAYFRNALLVLRALLDRG